MKNKRYKRVAKRIKGECLFKKASYCLNCKNRILCNKIIMNFYGTPGQVSIRELEQFIKE